MNERLVYDIETDGLYHEAENMLCLAIINADTLEEALYADSLAMMTQGTIKDGLERLMKASLTIGHNVINFDHPTILKLTGYELPKDKTYDTLVACRLVFSNIKDIDLRRKDYNLGALFGSHSLEAWGIRLGGQRKMEYAPVIDPDQPVYDPSVKPKDAKKDPKWKGAIFTPMMGMYCMQDVRVNVELFKRLERKQQQFMYDRPMLLEHQAAWVLSQQERNGFKFDEEKAIKLLGVLSGRREFLYSQLISVFGGWWVSEGVTTPKRSINYKDPTTPSRVAGAPFTKVKWVDFNPSSRKHIIKVLCDRGWIPKEFTPSGEAKVDETILEGLNFPEAKLMAEWFMIQKRLGQLADGQQSWLNTLHKDGYIRGSINPNGAVTGRATHSFPNIAQVPSCGAPFGAECRELFTVPNGWVLLGSDASGLELRCLGNFMAKYDDGAYIDVVLNGDIHWANAQAAGFIAKGTVRDPHNPIHEEARRKAKTFIYAFLYGCGAELTGEQVGWTEEEYLNWKAKGAHKKIINKFKRQGRTWTREQVCNILKGEEVQKAFMKGLPALKLLIDECKQLHKTQGFIEGVDGRRIYTRSEHASLNTLLQGAGALVCKQWVVEVERLAIQAGYKHGLDGDFMYCAWVHDELQIACRTQEIAEHIGKLCQQAMTNVEKEFNFICRLDAEYQIGKSWKETH
ncbi:DNA polymerase [Vibrio parahaemolyticus]|nr:DNA polymerase [Vibrio parahaemolyticus]